MPSVLIVDDDGLVRETVRISDVNTAEQTLAELMDRMDVARSSSITPPEWAFEEARRKIDAGHYSFAVDAPPKLPDAST